MFGKNLRAVLRAAVVSFYLVLDCPDQESHCLLFFEILMAFDVLSSSA
jgi:hypothetical protein